MERSSGIQICQQPPTPPRPASLPKTQRSLSTALLVMTHVALSSQQQTELCFLPGPGFFFCLCFFIAKATLQKHLLLLSHLLKLLPLLHNTHPSHPHNFCFFLFERTKKPKSKPWLLHLCWTKSLIFKLVTEEGDLVKPTRAMVRTGG